jgi:hypothetical protein
MPGAQGAARTIAASMSACHDRIKGMAKRKELSPQISADDVKWHHTLCTRGHTPYASLPSSRGIPRGYRCRQRREGYRPCATHRHLLRRLLNLRPPSVVPRWLSAAVEQSPTRGGLVTILNPSPIRCQKRRHSKPGKKKGVFTKIHR